MKTKHKLKLALLSVLAVSQTLHAQEVEPRIATDAGITVSAGQNSISEDLNVNISSGAAESYAGYQLKSDANVVDGVLKGTDIIVTSDSLSQYLIGIELEDGASLGNMSGNITVSSKFDGSEDLTAGIYMGANSSIGDIDGSISVSSGTSTKVYAIYFEDAASTTMGTFSGSIEVNSEVLANGSGTLMENNAISGYDSSSNAESLNNGMSSTYIYNEATGSSAGVLVDWAQANFKITSKNTYALGAIVGANSTSMTELGGSYIVDSGLGSVGFTLSGTLSEFKDSYFTGYISASSTGSGGSIGFRLTFEKYLGSQFGDFTAESQIFATNTSSGSAIGIQFDYDSQIGGIAGTVEVNSQSGKAVGVNSASGMSGGSMAINGAISGSILAKSEEGDSYGMHLNSTSVKGEITGDIQSLTVDGDAYGLKLDSSSLFDVAGGNISAKSENGNAYGVVANSGTTFYEEFTGNISADTNSTEARAYGIVYEKSMWLSLHSTANITATQGAEGAKSHGVALQNTSAGIYLRTEGTSSAADRVQINGDLDAGTNRLRFSDGYYEVDSRNWTSGTLQLGSGTSMADVSVINSGLYQNSSDVLELTSTTLDIYLNSTTDYSSLELEDSLTLDMSSVDTINIYLNEGFFPEDELIYIQLIDAELVYLTEELGLSVTIFGNDGDRVLYDINETGLYLYEAGAGPVVPEPSTATLSILALAGLCARRRRKS